MNRLSADRRTRPAGELPFSTEAVVMRTPLHRFHQDQGTSNDCGPFCIAIAINALRGERALVGSAVAREMERLRWRNGRVPFPVLDKVPGWATLPWGLSDELRRHGVRSRWRLFTRPDRLLDNLRADRITFVAVGEPFRFRAGRWRGWAHVKLLYAWDPLRGWAFVDPGEARRAGNPWSAVGINWQTEEDFRRQWSWMWRFSVEILSDHRA